MYRITKDFEFSASHRLHELPEDHPCSRLHGHNYTVRLVLEADGLNNVGFVRDYRELDKFKRWLDDTFDHRDLNDAVFQPTAENLAREIFQVAVNMYPEVSAVGISETRKTWAWYMPDILPIADRIMAFFEAVAEGPHDTADRRRLIQILSELFFPSASVD